MARGWPRGARRLAAGCECEVDRGHRQETVGCPEKLVSKKQEELFGGEGGREGPQIFSDEKVRTCSGDAYSKVLELRSARPQL